MQVPSGGMVGAGSRTQTRQHHPAKVSLRRPVQNGSRTGSARISILLHGYRRDAQFGGRRLITNACPSTTTTIEWSWSVIAPPSIIDVHQHLWPPALIDALRHLGGRNRSGSVRLDGWTLHLPGEPPYEVNPAHHDLALRVAQEEGTATALVSLSSPLGIEGMAPDVALPLLAAWHDRAAELPAPFCAWAAVPSTHPDLADLDRRLEGDFVGLQVP